jgi:hypothetical protein
MPSLTINNKQKTRIHQWKKIGSKLRHSSSVRFSERSGEDG